jgi:shikimate kinase
MPSDIVLIGPLRAGKSTAGKLLSQKLGLPLHEMDTLRWQYYKEIGFEMAEVNRILARDGVAGVYRHWKPFEAHAVERLLAEHTGCVFAFGGGHSVQEDPALFERVRKALEPYDNVVLLLPSPDLDESVRLLRERSRVKPLKRLLSKTRRTLASLLRGKLPKKPQVAQGEKIDLIDHFVRHHSNHDLAKIVVYTHGKTPEQTCDEILSRLRLGTAPGAGPGVRAEASP